MYGPWRLQAARSRGCAAGGEADAGIFRAGRCTVSDAGSSGAGGRGAACISPFRAPFVVLEDPKKAQASQMIPIHKINQNP